VTYNPFLEPSNTSAKGGEVTIEHPATVANIQWQTRPAPLTDEENALADALVAIFAKEIWDLADVVAALNRMGPSPVSGGRWTDETLTAALARLDLSDGGQ
jgi:hypothetical protein